MGKTIVTVVTRGLASGWTNSQPTWLGYVRARPPRQGKACVSSGAGIGDHRNKSNGRFSRDTAEKPRVASGICRHDRDRCQSSGSPRFTD